MLSYHPYDEATKLDPYPLYRRMRDEVPVYHNEEAGFWALTRYDDVLRGFLDPTSLISSEGVAIDGSDKGMRVTINTDDPEHMRRRKILSRVFTPRRVAELEPFVRELANEHLDALAGEPEFDIVTRFALEIPLNVIGELIGIPPELRPEVHHLSDRIAARSADDSITATPEDAMAAAMELDAMLRELVVDRRAHPRGDIINLLIDAEWTDDAGRTWRLDDGEIASEYQNLAFAGHETVTNAIGNGIVALAWYPDQRRELVADRGLIPNAVEELLRWDNPAPLEGRWTAREVEFHGTTIPEGQRVMLVMGSANHDERQYEEPELFDIHRKIERPLVFGFGTHLCLGAALARLELRVAFEEFLRRYPDYELVESGIGRAASATFRGHAHLPVRSA